MTMFLVNCHMGFVAANQCVAFGLDTSYDKALPITNKALEVGECAFFEGSEAECLALQEKITRFAKDKQKETESSHLLYTNLTLRIA